MNTGALWPHRDNPAGTPAIIRRDRGVILIRRARRGLTAAAAGTSRAMAAVTFHASHSRAIQHDPLTRHGLRFFGRTTGGTPAAAPAAPSAPAVVSGGLMITTAAVAATSPFWYLTRGTGTVALLLVSVTLCLGVANTRRVRLRAVSSSTSVQAGSA